MDSLKELQQQRKFAQTLRKNMTKEERHLWYDFLKTYPVQFRRQYTIGRFVADFYCHQAKLVVELDGSGHYMPQGQAYDKNRTAYLESQGLMVLRFSNLDVLKRFAGVCEQIDLTVKERMKGKVQD